MLIPDNRNYNGNFLRYINLLKWEKQADIIATICGKSENRNQYVSEGLSERSPDDDYDILANNLQEMKDERTGIICNNCWISG